MIVMIIIVIYIIDVIVVIFMLVRIYNFDENECNLKFVFVALRIL